MGSVESFGKPQNLEAETDRKSLIWRPGWIALAVVVVLVVAGGLTIPGLVNRQTPGADDPSATLPAPPSFRTIENPGASFTNGAAKLWELDLATAFPDFNEPRICYDWSKTPQHDGNTLKGGPLGEGPLVIGDVWVVWVVNNRSCDATDLDVNGSRLAGISAKTGEVVWSLDANSKWSCDALPSAPKLVCADLAGTIFTVDESGTRSDLVTFSSGNAAGNGEGNGRVVSWADGVVVVLTVGKNEEAVTHMLGLNAAGDEAWRDEFPGGYGLFGWEVQTLRVVGDVFAIWKNSPDAGNGEKKSVEQLRSARNGDVLATREGTVDSPYPINVGPRILESRSEPSTTEAGHGNFEIIDTSKTDYKYISRLDGTGILIRVGEEGTPATTFEEREGTRNLSLCNEQTTSSCRAVPGLELAGREAYGMYWPRLVNVDGKAHLMVPLTSEEEASSLSYAVAPVDFSHEASKGELGFTVGDEGTMGESDGFNTIVAGKSSSDGVRAQYVGSGDTIDIAVGDGGDWYPVPRMPENRILLSRSEKVGEVRGETHLAAWGPA